MTQVLSVDAAPSGVRAPSAAPVAPNVFAAALQQAGFDLDTATPQALFQMPALAEASNETLEACLAVALENLAAGSIPQSVLDALTAQLAGNGELEDASGQDADDPSELSELVGLLVAVAPVNVELPVASADVQSQDAPVSAATVVADMTGEPQAPAASVPPLPQAPVGDTPVETADVPPVTDAALAAAGKSEVPVGAAEPPEVPEAPSQKAAASVPVAAKAPDAASLPSAPADAVAVAAPSPDETSVESVKTAAAAPAATAPESETSTDKSVGLGRTQDAPPVSQPTASPPAAASVEAVVPPEALIERPTEGEPAVVDKAVDSLHLSDALAPTSSAAPADSTPPALGADQERMIARIAGAIVAAEQSGRSTVRVRLYPPELGTVRIEVSSVRGVVTARIEASSPATQAALQSNVAALRSDLRQAGIDIRALEVQYRSSGFSFGPQQHQQNNSGYEPQSRPGGASGDFHQTVETVEDQPALVAAGAVDLFI